MTDNGRRTRDLFVHVLIASVEFPAFGLSDAEIRVEKITERTRNISALSACYRQSIYRNVLGI